MTVVLLRVCVWVWVWVWVLLLLLLPPPPPRRSCAGTVCVHVKELFASVTRVCESGSVGPLKEAKVSAGDTTPMGLDEDGGSSGGGTRAAVPQFIKARQRSIVSTADTSSSSS